jgi:hypothetical protein
MLGHQLQQFGGTFSGAAVHQQYGIGADYDQHIPASAGDQEEIIGKLFDFERRSLRKSVTGEGDPGRRTGEAPQECTTVGWVKHRY